MIYLVMAGTFSLFFGLLFLFLPGWLTWLSKISDRVLVSTDELVFGIRHVLGLILIGVSFYIFYAALLMRK